MALPIVSSSKYTTLVPSLGITVEYRPYVVKEEKILMIAMESKDQKQIVRAIKEVIKGCVFDNIDVNKLTTLDIEVLFLRLRGKSVGERADLRFKCDSCEAMTDVSINLDDVQPPVISAESKNIMINDSVGIVVRYPSITDMEKYTEKQLASVDGVMNLITDCIESIFDDENVHNTNDEKRSDVVDFVDGLTSTQFKKVAEFFQDMPALTHDVRYNCISCDAVNEVQLKGLTSFFM